MAGETWAPTLADVARHVPTRTRDAATPGSDKQLGTFTATTTPTDEQAQAVITDAVKGITAQVGVLPLNLPPTDEVMVAARTAAEWRAAADIEIAYPNRDADVRLYDQLDKRADKALAVLLAALREDSGGPVEVSPEWNSPLAPPWADVNFDMIPGPGVIQ